MAGVIRKLIITNRGMLLKYLLFITDWFFFMSTIVEKSYHSFSTIRFLSVILFCMNHKSRKHWVHCLCFYKCPNCHFFLLTLVTINPGHKMKLSCHSVRSADFSVIPLSADGSADNFARKISASVVLALTCPTMVHIRELFYNKLLLCGLIKSHTLPLTFSYELGFWYCFSTLAMPPFEKFKCMKSFWAPGALGTDGLYRGGWPLEGVSHPLPLVLWDSPFFVSI